MPLTKASTVVPEVVSWLWPGYLPFGKVAMLDGDPGLGKSTLMLDLAARLTTGRALPNGKIHQPMGVLLFMGEDGEGDTIVPRLINAGADLARVFIRSTYTNPETKEEEWPAFPNDLTRLDEDIAAGEAGMVVIDPIFSYLAPDINSNNDQQVRRALMPLAGLATTSGAAIVLLRHANKAAGSKALYRGQGSIGFNGVARSALIVGKDPEDETRHVLASSKSNLGPPPPSLFYRLTGCPNGAAKVEWEGISQHTADTLMQQGESDREKPAHDAAVAFLRDLLAGGRQLPSKEVWREANAAGQARNTVLRAKDTLHIIPRKDHALDGPWLWQLPQNKESHAGVPRGTGDSWDSSVTWDSSDSSIYIEKNLNTQKNTMSHEASPNGIVRPAPPLAPFTGIMPCAECGEDFHGYRGQPGLCSACRRAAD